MTSYLVWFFGRDPRIVLATLGVLCILLTAALRMLLREKDRAR